MAVAKQTKSCCRTATYAVFITYGPADSTVLSTIIVHCAAWNAILRCCKICTVPLGHSSGSGCAQQSLRTVCLAVTAVSPPMAPWRADACWQPPCQSRACRYSVLYHRGCFVNQLPAGWANAAIMTVTDCWHAQSLAHVPAGRDHCKRAQACAQCAGVMLVKAPRPPNQWTQKQA